ncbi:hypothetical protein CDL15_Pgr005179 [Punica granatum]|uniref:Uncharacterized protein n=1 Tax=Punica granatum TaxID=22663 RepID=A0A218WQ37_PUNGR|nr:hypothetical protein CDL15_Pgr005179 [Punica granatum]
MAMTISNSFHCRKLQLLHKNYTPGPRGLLSPSFVRTVPRRSLVTYFAASAAGSSNSDGNLNPYELEKACDRVMMAQLSNRKMGVTFGSFKVSKDIKFADKQPIVPWGPRFSKSSDQDSRTNMAISAAFVAWVLIKQNAEYKPLQFLAFVFVYWIFEKWKAFEPPVSPTFTEDGEDPGRGVRMGKRRLRSLALIFGCIAFTSLVLSLSLSLPLSLSLSVCVCVRL